MYRDILRRLNFVVYIGIILIAVVLQTTIFGYFPLNYLQPDTMLILAVYFGFRRGIIEGAILVILGSMIWEAHSGAANHFFLTVYLYTFLIAKILSRTVVVPDFFSSIGIVVGLSLLKRIGLLLLLGTQGRADNGITHFFIYLIPGLLVQALMTPVCFGWFSNFDLKTYKDEHAEDEYDINKGF